MLESSERSPVDQQVGVLIVGAGPVGLCHALWLRQYDVDVLVIDADVRSHREEWVMLGADAVNVLNRLGIQRELDHVRIDYDALVFAPPRGLHRDSNDQPGVVSRPRLLRLPVASGGQAPLSLVNRAELEAVLERRARELGAQIERGQRLQRLEIRPTHCEARVIASPERIASSAAHATATPRDSARRLLAHWVIGTDGYHSVVRRDLRAAFRPIAAPRSASIVRLAGRRSVDVEGAVQVSAGEHAVHTVWPLPGEQLLWVTLATGPEPPSDLELDPDGYELISPLAVSNDTLRHRAVADAFLEREAPLLGIEVDEVLSRHAIQYRPSVAEPQGRGRAWTSGPAAQVIAPVLGLDDNLGLLEVHDLALLLGFGADDGMSGVPTLTPRLYHERRARVQQHALGAHPLGTEGLDHQSWSARDRDAFARMFPFLTRVAMSAKNPGLPLSSNEQPQRITSRL